jgi:divalent metal cation (Fe/Co/Zn/Cd) transporter
VTGNPLWDGLASVLIGLVLGALAIAAARSQGLLIGEAADPQMVAAIRKTAAPMPAWCACTKC